MLEAQACQAKATLPRIREENLAHPSTYVFYAAGIPCYRFIFGRVSQKNSLFLGDSVYKGLFIL